MPIDWGETPKAASTPRRKLLSSTVRSGSTGSGVRASIVGLAVAGESGAGVGAGPMAGASSTDHSMSGSPAMRAERSSATTMRGPYVSRRARAPDASVCELVAGDAQLELFSGAQLDRSLK